MIPALEVEITADPKAAEQGFSRVIKAQKGLEAATAQYKTRLDELTRAEKSGLVTKKQVASAISQIEKEYKDAASKAASYAGATATVVKANNAVGQSMRAAQAHTTNLMFQFQDIGMMLAAGQNPLMLAMQQGTQVAGVFHQMKASGMGAFAGIKSALLATISPMSLFTVGALAGGAALVQWGISAFGASKEADSFADKLDRLNRIQDDARKVTDILKQDVHDLAETYGDAADSVRKFAVVQAELMAAQAEARLADQLALVNDELERFARMPSGGKAMKTQIDAIVRQFDLAGKGAIEARKQALKLRQAFNDLSKADDFDAQKEALEGLLGLMEEMEIPLGKLPPELRRALNEMIELIRQTDAAREAMSRLSAEAANVNVGNMFGREGALESGLLPPLPSDGESKQTQGGGISGGSRTSRLASELEQLQESLMSERELELAHFEERQLILEQALEKELLTRQEYNDLKEKAQAEHNQKMSDLDAFRKYAMLNDMSGAFGDLANLMQSGNKKLFKIGKAAAIAEAVVSGYKSAVDAYEKGMKIGGPGLAAAFTAASLAKTGMLISKIKSTGENGGSTSGGGSVASEPAATPATPAAPQIYLDIQPNARGDIPMETFRGVIDTINDQLNRGGVLVT